MSLLYCGKEKIGTTNLLKISFYRINGNKDKKGEINKDNFDENLDMRIEYFEGWNLNFKDIFINRLQKKLDYYKNAKD